MKVRYIVEVKQNKYELHMTELTADQLDAIRIILKTTIEQSQKLKTDGSEFGLEGLIKAAWNDTNE